MTHLLGRQDCIDSLRRDLIDLQGGILDVFSETGPVLFPSWKFPDKLSCNLDLVKLLEEYDYIDGEEEFSQHSNIVLLELVVDRLMLILQSFNVHAELLLGNQRPSSSGQNGAPVSVGPVVKLYWKNLLELSNQYVQRAGMKETGEAVVSLCQSLGLPCSLKDLLVTVEEQLKLGHLSTFDVSQWASEQRKDMSRVGKHVLEVRETVEPLKKRLKETETERENLRKLMSETVNREKEQRRKMEEEWKNRIQEVKATGEGAVRKLKQEQEELKRGVMLLEDKNTELTTELNSQTEAKQSLECERASLQEEVLRLHSMETMLREVKERRENLENELRSTQVLLDKERAKSFSVQHQHEALQVKQHALCKRVDVLVQQTDDLQSSLEECEDEKVELADKLKQFMQEKDTIQEQLAQQQSECSSLCMEKEKQQVQITELEKRVSNLTEMLEQAAQRERILVAFPELNPHPQATPQTTGDVMCDMEQQLKANLLRIRVLQQENASLSSSLARLKDIQSREDKHRSLESGDAEMDTGSEAAEMRPLDNSTTSSITSTPASSSSILHHQTLCLSLNQDAEEAYMKIRHAARIRSAGTRRRRK
ncbi:coiled-coil domain-containing protein 157 isoform X2 [Triplophysa dalaica]|uniref:coiled-coil domain-containing protein 157 isoform X2 n=1 Tax=Triplophysa dalaica TaxID=1582913 RepID=UPI0024E0079F|nr:coiled-coil domain-containing protein 157 isoform X2 [Triplophysa dalaica]